MYIMHAVRFFQMRKVPSLRKVEISINRVQKLYRIYQALL